LAIASAASFTIGIGVAVWTMISSSYSTYEVRCKVNKDILASIYVGGEKKFVDDKVQCINDKFNERFGLLDEYHKHADSALWKKQPEKDEKDNLDKPQSN